MQALGTQPSQYGLLHNGAERDPYLVYCVISGQIDARKRSRIQAFTEETQVFLAN